MFIDGAALSRLRNAFTWTIWGGPSATFSARRCARWSETVATSPPAKAVPGERTLQTVG